MIPCYILITYLSILNFTVSFITLMGNFILVVNATGVADAL